MESQSSRKIGRFVWGDKERQCEREPKVLVCQSTKRSVRRSKKKRRRKRWVGYKSPVVVPNRGPRRKRVTYKRGIPSNRFEVNGVHIVTKGLNIQMGLERRHDISDYLNRWVNCKGYPMEILMNFKYKETVSVLKGRTDQYGFRQDKHHKRQSYLL